jgi:hypothetical protein
MFPEKAARVKMIERPDIAVAPLRAPPGSRRAAEQAKKSRPGAGAARSERASDYLMTIIFPY